MKLLAFIKHATIISFSILIVTTTLLTLLSVRAGRGVWYVPLVVKSFTKEVILRDYGPKQIPSRKFVIPTLKIMLKTLTAKEALSYHEQLFGFDIHFFMPHLFLFGFYEIFFRDIYFFSADNQTPFILDCGANIGLATLYFKMLYPQSNIIAFEPSPNCFTLLTKNITANKLAGVTAINKAVSNKKGFCSSITLPMARVMEEHLSSFLRPMEQRLKQSYFQIT